MMTCCLTNTLKDSMFALSTVVSWLLAHLSAGEAAWSAEARSGPLSVGPWERILQMTWLSLAAKLLIVLSAFLRRAPPVCLFLMFAFECITGVVEATRWPRPRVKAMYALHAHCLIFMVINLLFYELHCSLLVCWRRIHGRWGRDVFDCAEPLVIHCEGAPRCDVCVSVRTTQGGDKGAGWWRIGSAVIRFWR